MTTNEETKVLFSRVVDPVSFGLEARCAKLDAFEWGRTEVRWEKTEVKPGSVRVVVRGPERYADAVNDVMGERALLVEVPFPTSELDTMHGVGMRLFALGFRMQLTGGAGEHVLSVFGPPRAREVVHGIFKWVGDKAWGGIDRTVLAALEDRGAHPHPLVGHRHNELAVGEVRREGDEWTMPADATWRWRPVIATLGEPIEEGDLAVYRRRQCGAMAEVEEEDSLHPLPDIATCTLNKDHEGDHFDARRKLSWRPAEPVLVPLPVEDAPSTESSAVPVSEMLFHFEGAGLEGLDGRCWFVREVFGLRVERETWPMRGEVVRVFDAGAFRAHVIEVMEVWKTSELKDKLAETLKILKSARLHESSALVSAFAGGVRAAVDGEVLLHEERTTIKGSEHFKAVAAAVERLRACGFRVEDKSNVWNDPLPLTIPLRVFGSPAHRELVRACFPGDGVVFLDALDALERALAKPVEVKADFSEMRFGDEKSINVDPSACVMDGDGYCARHAEGTPGCESSPSTAVLKAAELFNAESDDVPRRARIDKLTPAELAIRNATEAVEALPADPRLTNAVVLLEQARGAVADFVDGVSSPSSPPTIPLGEALLREKLAEAEEKATLSARAEQTARQRLLAASERWGRWRSEAVKRDALLATHPELRAAIDRGAKLTAAVDGERPIEAYADDVSRAIARLLVRIGPRVSEDSAAGADRWAENPDLVWLAGKPRSWSVVPLNPPAAHHLTVEVTGVPGAGKTRLAVLLERALVANGARVDVEDEAPAVERWRSIIPAPTVVGTRPELSTLARTHVTIRTCVEETDRAHVDAVTVEAVKKVVEILRLKVSKEPESEALKRAVDELEAIFAKTTDEQPPEVATAVCAAYEALEEVQAERAREFAERSRARPPIMAELDARVAEIVKRGAEKIQKLTEDERAEVLRAWVDTKEIDRELAINILMLNSTAMLNLESADLKSGALGLKCAAEVLKMMAVRR